MSDKKIPTYIKKVEIINLWGNINISWNLEHDVNILSGVNGSGKSTILSMIYALLVSGRIHKSIDFAEKIIITFNNDEHILYRKMEISGSLDDIEEKLSGHKAIFSRVKEISEKRKPITNAIRLEFGYTSFEKINYDLDTLNENIEIDAISTFDTNIEHAKFESSISENKPKTTLDIEINNLQTKYLDYKLNLSREKDRIVSNEKDNDIKQEIDEINKPHALFLDFIDSLFSCTSKKINRDSNEIEILSKGKKITPFQLSSGEKQVLIILMTVLLQNKKQSILFMDEPEVSLHMDWQRSLINKILKLNPNIQIIVATHSPGLVMDGWMDKVNEISDIEEN